MPPKVSAERLVAMVCASQVLVQIGASFWPALLPGMMTLWDLTNSEAGWITAIFFGAYMVSVPVLVTATDRFRSPAGLSVGGRSDCLGSPTFWPFRGRILVSYGCAGTDRRWLGRHLYDRA